VGWRQLAEAWREGLHLAVERVRLYRQRSRQRRELRELDDRMLDDIGISRERAMQEARKPFWR
jgi:uncharacterized protein YjiS (DUF1127 family)